VVAQAHTTWMAIFTSLVVWCHVNVVQRGMAKELLYSVTAADCDWDYMRGTGPGGQKRNKTESKVRCTHRASGAVGESDETRDQGKNKRLAFRKMAETKEFKAWHIVETARKTGLLKQVEETVDRMMKETRVEIKDDKGRWTTWID
jgi:protein subunit release factor B